MKLYRTEDVIKMLRNNCEASGSQRAWAIASGVTPAYVNDVLNGRREPGKSITDALNLERETVYRPRD